MVNWIPGDEGEVGGGGRGMEGGAAWAGGEGEGSRGWGGSVLVSTLSPPE